jgi:hypothetical protein
MPETTPAPRLAVPATAIVALAYRGYDPDEDAVDEQILDDVRAIAAPVVAAELRRLADGLNGTHAQPEMNAGLGLAIRQLRTRATELDG